MRLIKATLMYDGSPYRGWQMQKNGTTLQEVFQKALSRITGENARVMAASRTDRGVHALGQVVSFRTGSRLEDRKLKIALNSHLPSSIAVKHLVTVPEPFHARFDARSKLYRYTIYNGRVKPVFNKPYVCWVPYRVDLQKMRQAARMLLGRHDFTSFSSPSETSKSGIRTLSRVTIKKSDSYIFLDVKGDGFLHHMVRVIVGTLLQVGFGRIPPQRVSEILTSKDRRMAGPTADPRGLMLVRVFYS